MPLPLSTSDTIGDGQDEEALALVRRADFRRHEESSFDLETKSAKLSPNDVEAERDMGSDIFEEDKARPRLDDDTPDGRPEVARVARSEALAGTAERLARIARSDEINRSAPRAAVEGSGIAPQSRLIHETRLHRCNQVRGGEGFPLHHADDASIWNCQLDGEVKSAAAGADGEDVQLLGR